MARIDRASLTTATFPVTIEIATRFNDLDVQGHVNNCAAVVLLQEARVAFNREAGLPAHMGPLRTMVASLTVEYAGELRHPAPVRIDTGVVAIGRTSYTLAQVVRQDQATCLFAQVVMVIADADGPAPVPPRLRAAFEGLKIA